MFTKLRYGTGIATLIQFVVLTFLNMATATDSVVSTCRQSSSDCVSNLIVSILYLLLIAMWFGIVWLLGYAAQDRRSKRLAQALIIIEVLIAMVAAFNAKHHNDLLGLATSLVDFGLAIWVIVLAVRLMRSKGGRVVNHRNHKRRKPTQES